MLLRQKLITVGICLLALALHIGLSSRFGLTPAVGPLLSPFEGFWQNAEPVEQPNVPTLQGIKGLRAPVTVRFDSALVPHIEAENLPDLFQAQGYVTASLRLWQMDFIARAAAGRMAEVFGQRALEYDRQQRHFGMGLAARAAADSMMADPATRQALEAYTAGANAYLAQLDGRLIPLEYKIFGYRPEAWTPLKTAYLLCYMAYNLTGHTTDADLTRAWEMLGPAAVRQLYPTGQQIGRPVIPASARFDFAPALPALADTMPQGAGFATGPARQADARNGSNNWALAGSRTASGKPLLANDPHLGLDLPSIWLQVQLSAPGLHVAGFTLPGAPGVIVGHNRAVAWGVTNADVDALDLYQVERVGPDKYLHNGKAVPLRPVVETLSLADGSVLLDTVLHTHLGPLAAPGKDHLPAGAALAWVAHHPRNALACFLGLAKAGSVAEAQRALGRLGAPAQSFALADTAGNIAMHVAGSLPLRQKGQGKYEQLAERTGGQPFVFIADGQNPMVRNPAEGFVASANQRTAGGNYPYYLNWRQSEPYRGDRLATRLGQMRKATVDTMAALQMDVYGLKAAQFLPLMLQGLVGARLSAPEQEEVAVLNAWAYGYDSTELAPSFFEGWFAALQDTAWDELRALKLPYPMHRQLYLLLSGQGLQDYVDVLATPEKECVPDLCLAAFHKAYQRLMREHGAAGKAWQWGRIKRTRLRHMAQVPGLGVANLATSGGGGTVNATGADHGPSMRMVVDLAPPVRAYGNQPGGQSGNPGSPLYLAGVADWQAGKPRPWLYYKPGQERYPQLMRILKLRPR